MLNQIDPISGEIDEPGSDDFNFDQDEEDYDTLVDQNADWYSRRAGWVHRWP